MKLLCHVFYTSNSDLLVMESTPVVNKFKEKKTTKYVSICLILNRLKVKVGLLHFFQYLCHFRIDP